MNPTTDVAGSPGPFSLVGGYQRIRAGLRAHRQRRQAARWTEADEARLSFYRSVIGDGGVVFDVGANQGNRAKVFLRLASKVVAVEPQPECVAFLRSTLGGNDSLVVEPTALGRTPGEATMLLSRHSTIATLDRDWVDNVCASGRFSRDLWNGETTVPVTTLDALIDRHGLPAFVKVDVEGFEVEVLAGLSQPVGALSLEFVPERPETIHGCLDELARIGEWRYQLAIGETMAFSLPDWCDRNGLLAALDEVPREQFGDIYARHVG